MRALLLSLALLACSQPARESTPQTPPPSTPVAPAPEPAPAAPATAIPTQCTSDADCVATNFAGCCACPQCSQAEPQAVLRAALEHQQAECARTPCHNEAMCGIAGMCPPGADAAHFVARCRDGACALDRR